MTDDDVPRIDPADHFPHPETVKFAHDIGAATLMAFGIALGISPQEIIDEIWANRLRPYSHTTIAPKPPEDGWTAEDYLEFSVITEEAAKEWFASDSPVARRVNAQVAFRLANLPLRPWEVVQPPRGPRT